MPGTELAGTIKTIFFDVGNTLRIVLPDQPFIDAAEKELMEYNDLRLTQAFT